MPENSQLQFLWKQISERAENLIPPVSFHHFIKDLEPIDLAGRKIVLRCSSDLNANSIMKKFADKLREAIVKCDLGLNDFRLVVDGSDEFPAEFIEDATETDRKSVV